MKHVILGNGAAGITAAAKLRELRESDDITIISCEDVPVYSKPMLPDYIGGKLSKDRIFLRDFNFYDQNRISFISGKRVCSIDTKNRNISLSDESVVEYDKLLVCTGGIPFIPPIEGLEDTEYFILNSVADADRIREKASEGRNAVIIGGGLTGIEVGFALKRLGVNVSIVEREDRVLPLQLDVYSSSVMIEEINREGIEVIVGKTVVKVLNDGERRVLLSDGSELGFDMLVLAIGTRPNIECIKSSDIKCSRGILVNGYMETSVKDVYAAGDVAELVDKVSNEYVSTYVWPNAMAQGRCAACSMAGQAREFSRETAMQNTVQLRDIPFISMGMVKPSGNGYETLISHDKEGMIYKKIVLRDNQVKGMVFIGDTANSRAISDFIRKGTNVAEFKDRLLERDFSAVAVNSK